MPLATCVNHATTGVCDIGLPCCPHGRTGTNGEGSGIFEIEGAAVHLLTHTGPTNCPHGGVFSSVEGSSMIECEGLPVTLVGHGTVCQTCGQSGAHAEGSDIFEVEN
jgi:uncharacterized Zn-binding protein involved in type VI secretion